MNKKRWASLIILALAGLFAFLGGNYSTPEYFEMKRVEQATRDSLGVLRTEIDSLTLFRDSLQNNPAVQERYARQKWGMLRPGELSFTVTTVGDTIKP